MKLSIPSYIWTFHIRTHPRPSATSHWSVEIIDFPRRIFRFPRQSMEGQAMRQKWHPPDHMFFEYVGSWHVRKPTVLCFESEFSSGCISGDVLSFLGCFVGVCVFMCAYFYYDVLIWVISVLIFVCVFVVKLLYRYQYELGMKKIFINFSFWKFVTTLKICFFLYRLKIHSFFRIHCILIVLKNWKIL